jgi:TP901 family phage tail tape measure protein
MADGIGTSIDVKLDATGIITGIKDAEKYLKMFPGMVEASISGVARNWDKSGKEILTIQSKNAAEGLKITEKYVRDVNGAYQNIGKNVKLDTGLLDKVNQQIRLAEEATKKVGEITQSKQFGGGAIPSNAQPGQIASFENAKNTLANFAKSSQEHGAALNKVFADMAAGQQKAYGAGTLESQASAKLQSMTRAYQDMGKAAWGAYSPIELIKHVIIFGYAYQLWYGFIASIKQGATDAQELAQRIAEIRTISQGSQLTPGAWGAGLTNISNQFGMDVIDVAKAAYETLSNQVAKGAEAFDFVGKSALFAKTTVATNAEAVDLLTGAINAYGMKSSDTTRISAELFKTIDLGRVRASDMANSFGQVAIQAEQLGVSFEDMLGVISSGTRKGIKYDELATQLRGVMTALIKPSEAMKTALREMGADSAQAAVQMFGLPGVVDRLAKSTGGASEEMARLFPNVRGLRLFMGLAGDGATQLADDIKKIKYDSLTEYGKAATDMMGSQAVKVAQLNTEFKNYFIAMGDTLNAVKASTFDVFGNGTNAITSMAHSVRDLVIAYGTMKTISSLGGLSGIKTSLAAPFIAEREAIAATNLALNKYDWEMAGVSVQTSTLSRAVKTSSAGFNALATSIGNTQLAAQALSAIKMAGWMIAIEEGMHLVSEAVRETTDAQVAFSNTKGFDTRLLTQNIETQYGKIIDGIDKENQKVNAKYGEMKGAGQRGLEEAVTELTKKEDVIKRLTGGELTGGLLQKTVSPADFTKITSLFEHLNTEAEKSKGHLASLKETLAGIFESVNIPQGVPLPLSNTYNINQAKIKETQNQLNGMMGRGLNEPSQEVASKQFDITKSNFDKLINLYKTGLSSTSEVIANAGKGGVDSGQFQVAIEQQKAYKEGLKNTLQALNEYNGAVQKRQNSYKEEIGFTATQAKKVRQYEDERKSINENRDAYKKAAQEYEENEKLKIEAASKAMHAANSAAEVAKSSQFQIFPDTVEKFSGTKTATGIALFNPVVAMLKAGKDVEGEINRFNSGELFSNKNTTAVEDFTNKVQGLGKYIGAMPEKLPPDLMSKLVGLAPAAKAVGDAFDGTGDKAIKFNMAVSSSPDSLNKSIASLVELNKKSQTLGVTLAEAKKKVSADIVDEKIRNIFDPWKGMAEAAAPKVLLPFAVEAKKAFQEIPAPTIDTKTTNQDALKAATDAYRAEEERKQAFARQQEQLQYRDQVQSINARAAALQETIKHESTLLGITKEQTRLMETQNRLSKEQSANSDKIALLQLQSKLYGTDNTKEIENLQYKSDKAQEEALKNKIDSQGTSDELARKQAAEELRVSEVAKRNQARQQQQEAANIQNDKVRLNEEQRNKQSQYAGQAAAQNMPQDETFKNTIASFGVLDTAIITTANYLNQMSGQPQVQQAPLQQAAQQQQQAAQALGEAAQQQEQAANSFNAYQKGQVSITGGYQYGGMVKYFANGGPSGTDTIPAYLTPGEYVVNARAAAQNRAMLDHINFGIRPMTNSSNSSSKTQYFNTGGVAVNISNNGSNGVSRSQALNIGNTIAGELKRGTLKFAR